MNYTVVWLPSAEQALADLWTRGPDRDAVTAAANTVDSVLRRDPLRVGESRLGGHRILFMPPLMILYEVQELDRVVTVEAVKRSRRQP